MFNFHFHKPAYLIVLLFLNFSLIAQEAAISGLASDYEEAVNYLFNIKSTGESFDLTSEIILKRDVGSFRLKEGTLYPCTSYKGISYAILFLGKGEFSFTPATEIEQKQLYRFYETEEFSTDFKKLFLVYDDDSFEELFNNIDLLKKNVGGVENDIEGYLKYFKNGDVGDSRSDFLRSLMVQGRNGFFYSQIEESSFEPIFFQISPFSDEEVTFMKNRTGSALIGSDKRREIINQFPAQNMTFKNYFDKKPNKYFLDLISYKIEATISDGLDFSAKCIIDFKSEEKDQEWVQFYLFDELIVDSVKWENETDARYINLEESGELWVGCKKEFLDGEPHYVTIYYKGDLLEKDELGWIYLRSSIYWYPRYDNREKTAFGFIFHTSSKYDFVSVGRLITRSQNEDVITTKWFCETPIRNASFSIGNFEDYQVKKENSPEVNVYISEYGHQKVSNYLIKHGIYSMSDASEYIAQDVSCSMELFTALFGKPPFNSVIVTEIPYMHGEAFPGLLHLSWATVVQTNFEGEDEIFRAHEAAHQWWGIGVDFETYHDQWLSEGFATYSGLWYLQAAKNDNKLFFDMLTEWKDEILNVRKYILESGQESGPIWLGYRTSSTETEGDYDLIVYKKGAWIIHMLRAMLLDLNTMNEDRIKNLMRDYYETYKNKSASTTDFKKIVDKHCGEDMGWFFDQYVYKTDIPLYKVAYKTEETDEGKHVIKLRIRQEEVPENFKMYVPIKFIFVGDKIARIRIKITGKETIYSTPPVDSELDELVFNDLESVLCNVEYEDWE